MTEPMKTGVKYKLGQIVWINSQLKAKQFTCNALKILCTYNGYSASEWGETTRGDGGYPWRVFYSENGTPKDDEWTSEELLFETKEDLLKSL